MTDKIAVWDLLAGMKGYISGDLNMNAEVEYLDKFNYKLLNIEEEERQIPE